jgi:hypothetical protein
MVALTLERKRVHFNGVSPGFVIALVILATSIAACIPGRHASRAEVNALLRHF